MEKEPEKSGETVTFADHHNNRTIGGYDERKRNEYS